MKTIILSLFMAFALVATAQTESTKESATEDQQKERLMKTLNLSEEEAEKVYPIVTEYRNEKKIFRQKQMKQMRRAEEKGEEMSEEEIEREQRMRFQARRDKLEMDQRYYDMMLEVLPASKVEEILEERREKRQVRARKHRQINNKRAVPAKKEDGLRKE